MQALQRESGPPLVSGEFPLTAQDFQRIAQILHADSGIRLREGRAALVYSRLGKRLRALGLQSFRDYCELVAGADGLDERRAMLAALTTNVTRFFREPHHFDHLKVQLNGALANRVRAGGRLRLWSAGCSTGEEPYSIAMTLLSVFPNALDLDIRILATDIDPNVVATAREGNYSADNLEQLPSQQRNLVIQNRSSDQIRMSDDLKALISFGELNLMGDWPMKGKFDFIFCRNVAIYFDDVTQERLWGRFGDKLHSHGRLYIGHSERIADQKKFQPDGQTVYKHAAVA
jgi:chemotaxis protein methyltransferase CheR